MHKSHSNPAPAREVERQVVIAVNPGLGTALARKILEQAKRFDAEVVLVARRGGDANGRSLFEMLSLGAKRGDEVLLRCVGTEAALACEAIAAVLERDDG